MSVKWDLESESKCAPSFASPTTERTHAWTELFVSVLKPYSELFREVMAGKPSEVLSRRCKRCCPRDKAMPHLLETGRHKNPYSCFLDSANVAARLTGRRLTSSRDDGDKIIAGAT
jgi:hypothetical protein